MKSRAMNESELLNLMFDLRLLLSSILFFQLDWCEVLLSWFLKAKEHVFRHKFYFFDDPKKWSTERGLAFQ